MLPKRVPGRLFVQDATLEGDRRGRRIKNPDDGSHAAEAGMEPGTQIKRITYDAARASLHIVL